MIITASGLFNVPVAFSDMHITRVELKCRMFGKVNVAFISPLSLGPILNSTPYSCISCTFSAGSLIFPLMVHSKSSPLILQLKVTVLCSLDTT